MASLEVVSTQTFDCVQRNHNRKKKDLKVLVRDPFNNCCKLLVDDGKSKREVLDCSSRSSVSKTKETNSNSFSSPGQPENPSRNDINMGASSLVRFWEARSQQSSPRHSPSKKVYKMAKEAANKNALQETERVEETTEKRNPRMTQEATCKPKTAKIAILIEDTSNKNGLENPEIERKDTEEGESSKVIVKEESAERKLTSMLSFAEKVNLWNGKEIVEIKESSRRSVIDVEEIVERKKEEVGSFEEGKSKEIEEYRINPQQVTSEEEETASHESREIGKEEKSSQGDEETSKVEEASCFMPESPRFRNDLDEKEMQDGDYSVESEYSDWVMDISQPQSYWDELRKQREKEVMANKDPKKDYMRNMIKKRTVTTFLASDFRKEIEKVIKRFQVEINSEEEEDKEEWMVECSTRYQEKLEEDETEKMDLETVTTSDGFEDDEAAMTTSLSISSNLKDHENTPSYETDVICELREQIKQLQIEMLELKSLVKACIYFHKSAKTDSIPGVDICGRVCGHEPQWGSKKCPICI